MRFRFLLGGLLGLGWFQLFGAENVNGKPDPLHEVANLDIEQLVNVEVDSVYSASKYEQKVTQAPASVSIVTSDEIKRFGHRTLADVLRAVRGLYVVNDRNYSFPGVRGFLRPGDYNSRVLLLVDGHRINDNIYDAAYYGYDGVVDVDNIERVEVIRGPTSSIYGSSAFLGVINVITKRGRDLGGVEVSGEAGGWDSYKGRFSYGKQWTNQVEWLLSGSYYTSDGQSSLYYPEFDERISADPRATHHGLVRHYDGEEAGNFFTRLGYRELSFSGSFMNRTKEVPTASFDTVFNARREEATDLRAYADLKYDHEFSEDDRLVGRLFYDVAEYDGRYPYVYAPHEPLIINYDETLGEWVGTEWQFTQRLWDRHTVLVGGEYRENITQMQRNYDGTEPRFYYLRDDRTSRVLGIYAQGELALLTNLVLNAGLRYDQYFQSFGDSINPRLGLIGNPWDQTTVKLLYGQAFRAPNAYEMFYYAPGLDRSQPEDLEPETIRTYEVVVEQYFAHHYRAAVSGFFYRIDDLISLGENSNTGFLQYQNVDQAESRGLEFEVEAKYPGGLLVRPSYVWQRSEDARTGRELSNSPNHLAKLNLAVPLYRDRLLTGLELQYHGKSRTLADGQADDFFLVNWTLYSQKLLPGLEVSATIYNLLDANYAYPGSSDHAQAVLEQDGLSFRLKLTYRF